MTVSQSIDTWSGAMTTQTKQFGRNPGARKFFVMRPDIRGGGKGHGMKIANEESLKYPGYVTFVKAPQPGFDYFTEKPQLIYDKHEGRLPHDLESYGGYWLVSDRMRQVLEDVDAEGFVFAECDYTLPDGSAGPRYYLCDIVRTLDALDEQASTLRVRFEKDHDTGEDVKIRSLLSNAKLVFNEEVVGSAHVFNQVCLSTGTGAICDAVLRKACKDAGLSGIQFQDFNF
ncbi:imm11 family protein [Burkholderia ubonensis]|uniref:imm11 family protein n=1 Tax=Burkholderia ubonensis TaxID=101571 RepID=UPI0009B43DCD|nr:DUF1629 domain-containing protein [Burkholderia ubonensis]